MTFAPSVQRLPCSMMRLHHDDGIHQRPALAAVATYAMLLAWNEYQYQFLLLSSQRSMTVAAAIDQFFDIDEAPWNYMMAIALVYSLPPIAAYYALRRYMVAGLTMGGVKG